MTHPINGSVITFDEIERSQSIPPVETIDANATAATNMATRAQDATRVPNWVFPILATALFALLGFVYVTIQKQLDQLSNRYDIQETWIRSTREQLIQHGWTVDPVNGQLHAPEGKAGK